MIFKANINLRIAGDQHGDRSRKIPPGRAVDMVSQECGRHLRPLSRLGCDKHGTAGLLRILDQEGNTEPHFASRTGGVERICDTGNGFSIHPRAVVRDTDDDPGILLFYKQTYFRRVRPDAVCGDIGNMER